MSVLFLGDLFYDYDSIAEDIEEIAKYITKNNQFTILNLEGSLTKSAFNPIKKRGEHLIQNDVVIDILKLLNVRGVSICNNHIYDYGEIGVQDTINSLKRNNIGYCGFNFKGHSKIIPIVVDDGNIRYEIYAATDPYEESVCTKKNQSGCIRISDLLKLQVKNKDNTCRIAFLHTGFEYNTLPSPRTIKDAHRLIDNGFDYIICSHPHLIQPYEVYKDRLIMYSLGNFYFSSFRQEFQEKKIANKEKGFCNRGLGISINGKEYHIVSIEYDEQRNKSYMNLEYQAENLNSYDSKEYKYNYWKNRNNHNPILTGNQFDTVKMLGLNVLYAVYGIYRKVIKRK